MGIYLDELTAWGLHHGLKLILVLVLMFFALKVVRTSTRRLFNSLRRGRRDPEAQKRADTLSSITTNALSAVIYIVAVILVLRELGIDIGPIIATAGIAGLAIGFGAQNLVKDIISGFFILLQDQVRVGDVVEVAGKAGLVEQVNLKMTVLRDLHGNVHYIPNGSIDTVTNMTKEYSRYVFDIGVGYREDVDEVIGVIRQVDEEMRADPEYRDDILEPIEILGLDRFADSAVIVRARTKTRPIQQWTVGREFNRRLKKAFDERNIEIPFPHMTVYLGADKEGATQPLNVTLKGREGDRQG